jgi:hypothetical protein
LVAVLLALACDALAAAASWNGDVTWTPPSRGLAGEVASGLALKRVLNRGGRRMAWVY